jgi:hypothetical protein
LVGYSGQPYGGGMSQQPAYGMGTGGQYSPQLRQAQTAWQNQYTGGQQQPMQPDYGVWTGRMEPMTYETWSGLQQTGDTTPETYAKYADPLNARNAGIEARQQQQAAQLGSGNPWMQSQRQPYGMGAQGMGNAYGYGGQQGNPWAQLLGMMGGQQQPQYGITAAGQQYGLGQAGTYNTPMNSQQTNVFNPQPAQGSTSFSPPPVSQPQAPLQAPRPAAPPPPAAPTRANYSPNNPFGGMYATPQGDAWEQQQRGGTPAPVAPTPAAPSPAAPGTDVMRKALAAGSGANQGTTNGYGYGTPGGYQLDTAPSTLDPGSMTGLLSILGGNVNGRNWQGQAADYATWYQNTYGKQAPGGPTAYWTT